jgi:hypothetical protein
MTDNMRVWDALKTTDPKYTTKVSFGRKFTAINAQWQLQRMTELFGPIGKGWGYTVNHSVERITDEYVLAIADVAIWWLGEPDPKAQQYPIGRPTHQFGPVRGMSPILEKGREGLRFDDDAGKKAMTDALTKGLSHLGLSADVFLGLFDDNKYIKQVEKQFSHPADFSEEAVKDGLAKNTTSTYDTEKRKAAEKFVADAVDRFNFGPEEISLWYAEQFSKKKTNREVVQDLEERHPDLAAKLEAAAEEVRLRQ